MPALFRRPVIKAIVAQSGIICAYVSALCVSAAFADVFNPVYISALPAFADILRRYAFAYHVKVKALCVCRTAPVKEENNGVWIFALKATAEVCALPPRLRAGVNFMFFVEG